MGLELADRITACRLCADRFAATATGHAPRPVVWFRPGARILIAGQAPGMKVHASGKPFTDPSGDRLRAWMNLDARTFYDRDRVAIVPMAFCFPGYNARGSDLPPPSLCARTWRTAVMEHLSDVRLTVLVGGYAQRWHLASDTTSGGVTATIEDWRRFAPRTFVLPHPSWRNTGWLKRHPWFETDVVPALQTAVRKALA